MKVKKKYSFKDGSQIWRILLSTTDKIIIETRNPDKKEAFYNCLDLYSGKKIFTGFQPGEKYWVGIETVHDDLIFFHRFTKPDMPGHKDIIVFSIESQKILWENKDYSFLFVLDNKVYSFVQQFESQKYFTHDLKTGELIEELKITDEEIINLNDKYESQKDYSDYLFPEKFIPNIADDKISPIISKMTEGFGIIGDVEYTVYEKTLLMNYYSKLIGDSLLNRFVAVDIETDKELFNEILNADANAFVPDSFFVYKNLIILLKEKSKVIVCELI
ncbi:DUF4905 domain-containing protein [Bacteroidota bacterium]